MRELSLHIIDVAENGIKASADFIYIEVAEDIPENEFKIVIEDNGSGIPEDMLKNITDPFVTSRTERRVGMGLSLLKEASERCGGVFDIKSSDKGTIVTATFLHDHIDRAPLGDMTSTIMTLIIGNHGIDLEYKHIFNKKDFIFNTKDIKEVLDEVPITDPMVLGKLRTMVNEAVKKLKKGID